MQRPPGPPRRMRSRRIAVLGAGVLAAAVVIGGTAGASAALGEVRSAGVAGTGSPGSLPTAAGAPLGYPALAGSGPDTWAQEPHRIVPTPAKAGGDIPPGGCVVTGAAPTAKVCWQGDPTGTSTVALVGDSHAFQWLGAMNALAKEHHWRLLSIIHNSCPFNTTERSLERAGWSHCQPAIPPALALIEKSHVRVLVTSTYRTAYVDQESAGAAGYVQLWGRLQRAGVAVIALGDTPVPSASPLDRVCAAGPDPSRCGVLRAVAERLPDTLAAAAKQAKVPFVDPVTAFCRRTWCPGVVGNVLVYRDVNHASNTYLVTTLPWLDAHLAPVIRGALHTKARPSHGAVANR